MDPVALFEAFAAAFEAAVADDNWSCLTPFLAEDVTYLNAGGLGPKCKGRDAVITYFQKDVNDSDRRFDSRKLEALTSPTVNDGCLTRRWRSTYTLAGVPDLVVEGEACYWFEGEHIKAIEEELTPDSMQAYMDWMQHYGDRLS